MMRIKQRIIYGLFFCLPLSLNLYADEFFDPTVRPKNIYRKNKQFTQIQELKLEMIVFTQTRKFAIINKKSYRAKDIIADKFLLVAIFPDHIVVEHNKEKHVLSITSAINRKQDAAMEQVL